MYKPASFSTVSPYLIVNDAADTIAFLKTVFGAEVLRTFDGPNGKVRHSEVRIDDTIVMVADAMPGWPPGTAHLHVYVADVDAAYARALKAGATSVQAPEKRDDEDKRGGVKDASGTTWWIATKVE